MERFVTAALISGQLIVCDGSCPDNPYVCEKHTRSAAALTQNMFFPKSISRLTKLKQASTAATLSTCARFYKLPLLAQRQCATIYGDNDNVLMMSRGGTMFHALLHWRTLNMRIRDYKKQYYDRFGIDHMTD